MFLAKARKKIFTAAGSAALGIALSFSAISMPMASAAGWGDILGIGIGVAQVAQQREQVRNYLNQLNFHFFTNYFIDKNDPAVKCEKIPGRKRLLRGRQREVCALLLPNFGVR